jgi:hypothetical protein
MLRRMMTSLGFRRTIRSAVLNNLSPEEREETETRHVRAWRVCFFWAINAAIYRKIMSLKKSCETHISGITNQKQTIDSLTDKVRGVSSSLPVRMD